MHMYGIGIPTLLVLRLNACCVTPCEFLDEDLGVPLLGRALLVGR